MTIGTRMLPLAAKLEQVTTQKSLEEAGSLKRIDDLTKQKSLELAKQERLQEPTSQKSLEGVTALNTSNKKEEFWKRECIRQKQDEEFRMRRSLMFCTVFRVFALFVLLTFLLFKVLGSSRQIQVPAPSRITFTPENRNLIFLPGSYRIVYGAPTAVTSENRLDQPNRPSFDSNRPSFDSNRPSFDSNRTSFDSNSFYNYIFKVLQVESPTTYLQKNPQKLENISKLVDILTKSLQRSNETLLSVS